MPGDARGAQGLGAGVGNAMGDFKENTMPVLSLEGGHFRQMRLSSVPI